MQIRAGNRQDEPKVLDLVKEVTEELGSSFDGQDLKNLEHSYFWFDGLCLVAEEAGKIIGVIAACPTSENTLVLSRLAVSPGARRQGVARALLNTTSFFARNMSYQKLAITTDSPSCLLSLIEENILLKLGFCKHQYNDEKILWHIPVNV